MQDEEPFKAAYNSAERMLGKPLNLPLASSEPANARDFLDLATQHTFGDSWSRPGLDDHTRALISITIAAVQGTQDPLRGQLRIALNVGVTKEEIVELFIHIEAYAGAARAFEGYQIAKEIFEEIS